MLSAGASDPAFALTSALPAALRNSDPPFEQGCEGKEQPSPPREGQVKPQIIWITEFPTRDRKILPRFQKVKGSGSSPPRMPSCFSCITSFSEELTPWPIPATLQMHRQDAKYPGRVWCESTWLGKLYHRLPSLLFWLSNNCIIQSFVQAQEELHLLEKKKNRAGVSLGQEILLCLNEKSLL